MTECEMSYSYYYLLYQKVKPLLLLKMSTLRKFVRAPRKLKGFRRVGFKQLFKQAVFTLEPNLVEMLGQTPNKGLHYKVWRHCWPENIHYLITKTDFDVLLR
eukprot:TRINITY_DN932_c0_g6_i1.p2 TRINITY_DN932_c0_g6~~TRINITY_DN932_c0_g6_i1.p2  ORF type:complete len:102 (+),score=8.97 TRINITY_DN932_c0_g6_i1:85-390(+)